MSRMSQLSLDDNLENVECDREILNYLRRAPHKNVNILHQTHLSNTFSLSSPQNLKIFRDFPQKNPQNLEVPQS